MKQLDPKAVWLFFVSFAWRWFLTLIILSVWLSWFFEGMGETTEGGGEFSFGFLNWLWIIIPFFLVLCFVWAKLTYHFYRYELTDTDFRKELGIISQKHITIPYDRIQNVDIHRNALARIIGLSDVHIQTAAGMGAFRGSEGQLPALSREDAEQLRNELIRRARETKNQGL